MKKLRRLNRAFEQDRTPFQPKVSSISPVPKGQGAIKGYSPAKRKWDRRCTVFWGAREVRGLNGWLPCPACVPTTDAQARQQELEHEERRRGVEG